MPVIDPVADASGAELYRLSRLYEFPDFVKRADAAATRAAAGLAASAYADQEQRRFPCHTPAATWLSCLFFEDKRASFQPAVRDRVGGRLAAFAGYWRIGDAVDAVRAKAAAYRAAATAGDPDDAYAYVWVDAETGAKERRLPIKSAAEVAAAADWLHTYRDRLAFADRHRIATKILDKAAQFGAALGGRGEFLERQAGRGIGDQAQIVAMLQGRALRAKAAEQRDGILKLAEFVRTAKAAVLGPAVLVKLAVTVDTTDRALGLTGQYGPGLPAPEDVIFGATFRKVAADLAESCQTTSGAVYDRAKFAGLSLASVRDLFGPAFATEVAADGRVDPVKMAELAATLPRPDAELLDRLMADAGLHPAARKAASAKVGFTQADYQQMVDQAGFT